MIDRIGIDPGLSGAVCALENGRVSVVIDLPIRAKLTGKGNEIDAPRLWEMLSGIGLVKGETPVYLEKVHSMPGQGVKSVFSFGESTGVIKGVVASFGLPLFLVTPQKWKKAAGLIGKDKDCARTLAQDTHPEAREFLQRKKDIGRADAILIAEFGG